MTHAHHWRIETPNGPTSPGVCACGEQREFRNDHMGDEFASMRQVSARIAEQKQTRKARDVAWT